MFIYKKNDDPEMKNNEILKWIFFIIIKCVETMYIYFYYFICNNESNLYV